MKENLAQIFGIIMTISFMFCYIPQILKIFKNRSSKDVSLGLIVMSICGYVSGMIYMFLTQFGIWWFMNYSVGLIMCIILIYAWCKYNNDSIITKDIGRSKTKNSIQRSKKIVTMGKSEKKTSNKKSTLRCM